MKIKPLRDSRDFRQPKGLPNLGEACLDLGENEGIQLVALFPLVLWSTTKRKINFDELRPMCQDFSGGNAVGYALSLLIYIITNHACFN